VDLDKYHVGAALMRNFFVDYRGGASTRPGTELVDRTKNPNVPGRLVPFIFSQEQSYVLELGDFYMRFIANGSQLLRPATNITSIVFAPIGQFDSAAHGLTTGQTVYITGIGGMDYLNNRSYIVFVINPGRFSLTTLDGVPVNTVAGGYTGGGTVAAVYEIATPWSYIDLPKLKFVQSADVMTFTHHLYPIQNLSRTTPSTFTLTPEVIGSTVPAPTGLTVVPTTPGPLTYGYLVCAVSASGERSLPSAGASADSDPLDQNTGVVEQLSWDPMPAADHFDIFKAGPVPTGSPFPTYYGYIGSSATNTFVDNNIGPDYNNSPPTFKNPFAGGQNPGCVTYYQQRKVYANLPINPQEMDFSRVGQYSNFDTSFGVLDSDAIQISIASRQVNEIVSMVSTASGLVVLTSGGAFQVSGGAPTAAVTPSNIVALPQASSGTNDLPPIVVNYDILFVQNKGAIVRDLAYNFYLQTFYGFDRSALSNHLFFGHQLKEWAWAEEPFKIIWATRDDGKLLSLTYVPEQEVYGWAQHDTQGVFESVCSVPEGMEDAVYFIVQRFDSQGRQIRYIERMASRHFIRVEDAWCVDCGVGTPLNRPHFGFFMNQTSSGFVKLGADTGTPFHSGWLGVIIWLDVGGKLKVTSILSSTEVECEVLEPVGNQIPGTESPRYFQIQGLTWGYAGEQETFAGLWHLAGLEVSVLADGMSVGPIRVTDDGQIRLPYPASKVWAGLPFQAQLQTLYLDVGEPTIQGKRKKVSAATVRVDQSRAILMGETFDDLSPFKPDLTDYSIPEPLYSGDQRIIIDGSWSETGQVAIQVDDPLPATILGIIPEVTLGDTGS
jgi:hypothetical protein